MDKVSPTGQQREGVSLGSGNDNTDVHCLFLEAVAVIIRWQKKGDEVGRRDDIVIQVKVKQR